MLFISLGPTVLLQIAVKLVLAVALEKRPAIHTTWGLVQFKHWCQYIWLELMLYMCVMLITFQANLNYVSISYITHFITKNKTKITLLPT